MEEMPSGIKAEEFSVLEFLIIFFCANFKASTHVYATDKVHEWATWTASLTNLFECTFVNHPSIVSDFNLLWHNKICIANIMKSDATNQIRYRNFFLGASVNKQLNISVQVLCNSMENVLKNLETNE